MEAEKVGMSYEVLVEEGRAARREADGYQWREGELALQVEALSPDEQPRDPETGKLLDAQSALKRYAEDIDLAYPTLRGRRATALAWPVDRRRSTVSFETHRALNDFHDRFDLIHDGMKLAEARKIVSDRTRGAAGKPGWFELLGIVGDTLTKAGKELAKAEAAMSEENIAKRARKPNAMNDLANNAATFSGRALAIAEELRELSERLAQH